MNYCFGFPDVSIFLLIVSDMIFEKKNVCYARFDFSVILLKFFFNSRKFSAI